jgi:hypothetical protein
MTQVAESGKATAAMVLGILSVLCFGILAGIPAIILGVMARKELAAMPPPRNGEGKAMAGIVLGGLSVVWTLVLLAMVAGSSS